MKKNDYFDVTEISGDDVSAEQVERITQRYIWASSYCKSLDVIEIGCGTGQGLGLLNDCANKLIGTDYSDKLISIAKDHYKDRVELYRMDAHDIKFPENSFDVIILFEAIYYLEKPETFISEAKRVLRKNGILLIATANCSLFDFNPSPYTFKYFSVTQLNTLLSNYGFSGSFFGGFPVSKISLRQKIFRPLKKLAVNLNIIPSSMAGKKLLKRIVFGSMVSMPHEIRDDYHTTHMPEAISSNVDDIQHKVIYCAAINNK